MSHVKKWQKRAKFYSDMSLRHWMANKISQQRYFCNVYGSDIKTDIKNIIWIDWAIPIVVMNVKTLGILQKSSARMSLSMFWRWGVQCCL